MINSYQRNLFYYLQVFHRLTNIIYYPKYSKCQCRSPSKLPLFKALNHGANIYLRKLEGSCQCGLIGFSLQSQTPVPYQLCACSICRKCGGYGGCVNLGGIASTLEITKGKEHIKYFLLPLNFLYYFFSLL